jgi:hypothetical protein
MYAFKKCTKLNRLGLGLWWSLTPLSTIFQLYHSGLILFVSNIVESGVKHHQTNKQTDIICK